MPNPIDEQALQAIRTALSGGPLRQGDLVAALNAAGDGFAVEQIIPAARAGLILARDVYDDDTGAYIEGEFCNPEDGDSWSGR